MALMMLPKDHTHLAWLRRGHRRKRVLRFLSRQAEPVTPSLIAKALSLHRNKVSVTLTGLRERGLVAVIDPKAAYDRLYRITGLGKRLLVLLSRNEKVRNL